jgi:hypothetical protein
VEGIWSLLERSVANFVGDQAGLVCVIKRKLKLNKIQYRSHLIDGCLAATGLKLSPDDHMHYELSLRNCRAGSSASCRSTDNEIASFMARAGLAS